MRMNYIALTALILTSGLTGYHIAENNMPLITVFAIMALVNCITLVTYRGPATPRS